MTKQQFADRLRELDTLIAYSTVSMKQWEGVGNTTSHGYETAGIIKSEAEQQRLDFIESAQIEA